MQILVFCIGMLCVFTGCVQQRGQQKSKILSRTIQQTTLVTPSTELSAQSKRDECAFLSPKRQRHSRKRSTSSVELVKQYEARLYDVPVLVTAVAKRGYSDDQGRKMLEYRSSAPLSEVKNFYIQEMERFGWQQEFMFEGHELLLHFKKPQRFCSISIRPVGASFVSSKRLALHLFVSA